jgi:hypothetical protein
MVNGMLMLKKTTTKIFYLLLPLLLCLGRQSAAHAQQPDSADVSYYARKSSREVILQNFSLNLTLWGFNRFITKLPHAHIDLQTIQTNLSHLFVWDNDQLSTNMFLHPYQGSIYYNSARSQGFGYGLSGAFALGGSATWELIFENEYPSFNDIVATPIGGMALGESFFRLSDLVLDDRETGTSRLARELAGLVLSPARSLTRVLNGDAWRIRATTGRQFSTPSIALQASAGVKLMSIGDSFSKLKVVASTSIAAEYGERFSNESDSPFDYFTLSTCINVPTSQPLLSRLNVVGRLCATDLVDTDNDFLSLGAYQNFEYYDSKPLSTTPTEIPYSLSAPASFGAGFIYQNRRPQKVSFDAFLHANLVLLGGVQSDHYKVGKRSYNMASGFSAKAGFRIAYKDKVALSSSYEGYLLYTWDGYSADVILREVDEHEFSYQGDNSTAVFGIRNIRLDVKLVEHLVLTYAYSAYVRRTVYEDFATVRQLALEREIMVGYWF